MAKSRAEFGSIKKNTVGKFVSRDWEGQWSQGQLETIEGGKMILFTNKISNSTYKKLLDRMFLKILWVSAEEICPTLFSDPIQRERMIGRKFSFSIHCHHNFEFWTDLGKIQNCGSIDCKIMHISSYHFIGRKLISFFLSD